MATSLLVQSGSAVLPLEYSFIYPPSAAAWAMDRFIPSSRQPQHWSRNYHGSQERRRSIGRRRGSPDSQEKDASSYRQGVTLRAEDLLVDSENKLGTGNRISPSNHITPRPGDSRRALVCGSAKVLATQVGDRQEPVVRRSSEGGNCATTRKKSSPSPSSSSSNAADDPTSSDPSSSCTTTSSSSSSESGCNGDSETCNYCRLSESSEARESSSSSTEDGRTSSPSPPKLNNGNCRRLTRALSEDCYPPSRTIRRTSPGEYLRHKRDQMERMRQDPRRPHQRHAAFQRCDSDPRLSTRGRQQHSTREPPADGSPSRTLTFASPARNRIATKKKQPNATTRKKNSNRNDEGAAPPSPPFVAPGDYSQDPLERPRRSALAKNVAEEQGGDRGRSGSREPRHHRRSSGVPWSDESTPFLARRGSYRCAVCDCDIPFTNCVLCDAEAKGFLCEEGGLDAPSPEVFALTEGDLVALTSSGGELVVVEDGEPIRGRVVEEEVTSARSEKEELEEFYDRPTPVEVPPLPVAVQPQQSTDEKRAQWTSTRIHKSFNHQEEEERARNAALERRRSSLRKYNSEPVPETEEFQYSEAGTPPSRQHANGGLEQKAETSVSSAGKSDSRAGYHVAKDSPRKDSPQESGKGCHLCGKTTEDEEEDTGNSPLEKQQESSDPFSLEDQQQQRKSPAYLKPEFVFEPEIIHKANPIVDEADVDLVPSAAGAFRRLSEEEFISTLNIHEAAKKGDLHVVKLLTKKDPKQMETVDERGWTPIHLAAAHGHTEVVKFLALEGAHLAALDPSSYTAIHLASMNGHNSCLEVLLPLGVDVDSVTLEGFTALHLAVMNCHLECIQTLLQWGASLDKRDALGRGINDMVEEYNLQDVAALLRRFHKQLHNFKHMLEMMNKEGSNSSEVPREFMDILASIAEESGTE